MIFAANHQSHMDTPVILAALPARLRYRVATAMAKEFFKAHFFPEQYSRRAWFTNSLNYYLAALFFNAFPLPQREAGARQTLRYVGEVLGDGFSVLIFPEGKRSDTGRDRTLSAGHRHDRVAAGRAGRAGADRRARQGAAPHVADGAAGPGPRRVRRADAADGRRLRGAGPAGRRRRPRPRSSSDKLPQNLVIWSSRIWSLRLN